MTRLLDTFQVATLTEWKNLLAGVYLRCAELGQTEAMKACYEAHYRNALKQSPDGFVKLFALDWQTLAAQVQEAFAQRQNK